MIPRYSTPEMTELWSPQEKVRGFLTYWQHYYADSNPKLAEAIWTLKNNTDFTEALEDIENIEKVTKHDAEAVVVWAIQQLEAYLNPYTAGRLHLGLTSSDVVDSVTMSTMAKSFDVINSQKQKLCEELRSLVACENVCIGRTHGQYAELVTMGFKFLSHLTEFEESPNIFQAKSKASGSVGTGAHNYWFVDQNWGATQVIPRRYYTAYVFELCKITNAIERLALQIRLLSQSDVGEVSEGFAEGQHGSSSMPHKHNPISSENLCGISRLMRGYLMATMENEALWHERDISHSSAERIILPDASQLAHYALIRMTSVIKNLQLHPDKMRENVKKAGDTIYSQAVFVALVENRHLRNESYEFVQKNARYRGFLETATETFRHTFFKETVRERCNEAFLTRNAITSTRLACLNKKSSKPLSKPTKKAAKK